ncbi:MAG: class I SAM-dependent methyltransferase [Bradyrhizobiaceae bacterium]|nr:class I SAM-dependent methyltransferase [Bradyrhizobiaceae bacterium]
MTPVQLPLPPESLRVWVGPFSDPHLFERSGDEMAQSIVRLCRLSPGSRILEVGCGCGRLARALASYLGPAGSYEGFDIVHALVDWCKRHLESPLPNFRFSLADIQAPGYNPAGVVAASAYRFPFAAGEFDAAVVSSVFTHMLAGEIENYITQLGRVLKPGAHMFITVLLFDEEAMRAVAQNATAFHFRHPVGPCMTFDRNCPREGIACPEAWLIDVLRHNGFGIGSIQRGNWRQLRSCEVSHDIVVARRDKG